MSKILPITLHPNPILRKKSKDLDLNKITEPSFQQWLLDMEKTMIEEDGVGLAAPQVGQNIRVVAIKNGDNTLFMINPVITKRSWSKHWDQEGCLSIPNVYGEVFRHKKINCTYIDQTGQQQKLQAENFLARVIQHEVDHIDGILFIDKAKNIENHGNQEI